MAADKLDIVSIRDLGVRCIVGVYPQERRERQDIVINVSMYGDLSAAGRTDDITQTIDYKAVKKRILEMVEVSHFFLIERLAERVAELCLEDERVQRVRVTVDKPGALRFAKSAAVEIVRERTMARHCAYLGVSANIDPERNITIALEFLAARMRITAISPFYSTVPIARPDQPWYLNGVIRVETDLEPRRLKTDVLRDIEALLGRVRTEDAYAARPIDLDILLYDSAVINEPDLRIPDPDIRQRSFLAAALLELDSGMILPDTSEPVAALPCLEGRNALSRNAVFTENLRKRFRL